MTRKLKQVPSMLSCCTGFTLIEVVIAMAIFAIIPVLVYDGFNSVKINKQITDKSMQRLTQLQLTMTRLHRDIEQLVTRSGIDELGSRLPALSSQSGEDYLLQLSRNGWRNPADLNRSHLQRVAYELDEDKLVRINWAFIDRADDSLHNKNTLIDNIRELNLRFQDEDKQWHDNWPPLNASGTATQALPAAIEVTLHMEDWGEIIRLFRVAG